MTLSKEWLMNWLIDRKWPLMEDDFQCKMTFDGRWPLMEDDLELKTIFDGGWPLIEDYLWSKTTQYVRWPLCMPGNTFYRCLLKSDHREKRYGWCMLGDNKSEAQVDTYKGENNNHSIINYLDQDGTNIKYFSQSFKELAFWCANMRPMLICNSVRK